MRTSICMLQKTCITVQKMYKWKFNLPFKDCISYMMNLILILGFTAIVILSVSSTATLALKQMLMENYIPQKTTALFKEYLLS